MLFANYRRILFAAGMFGMCLSAFAQPATDAERAGVNATKAKDYATMHFETKLGMFRLIDGVGRVEFTFTGTVLLSHINGTASVTGKVRKEYATKDRVAYTGSGKVLVVGSFRAVQWFGSNMKGIWYGRGVARIRGEFDKDLNTGWYWYDDPGKKDYWPTAGTQDLPLPPRGSKSEVVPKVETKKKGG